jgi:hypothetical protein
MDPITSILGKTRQYWMICRGLGFFADVWFVFLCVAGREVEGVGEELNRTTARKAGPLYIIHSILSRWNYKINNKYKRDINSILIIWQFSNYLPGQIFARYQLTLYSTSKVSLVYQKISRLNFFVLHQQFHRK